MTTLTFVVGMERFNAHVWEEVQATLRRDGLDVRIHRFNDDHVNRKDPALVAAIHESEVLFLSLLNFREQAEWLEQVLAERSPRAVFAFESMPEIMA
ncbi:MAG: DUF3479 domain-containing protein, partial [Dehalococcoidia bacterium]|nr:DUF3479 domain-containing protein [Dehalococcoidia bacterium]